MPGLARTLSPGAKSVTPAPVAITVPAQSPPGTNGGDIVNVTLADGVTDRLRSGSGADGDATHDGGRGGNITNVVAVADQLTAFDVARSCKMDTAATTGL